MYKKVFYNTAFQVFGKAVTASATLLITILIGNALGESGYGDFTKIFVFVGYFYTLADFGLNSVYVKIATHQRETQLLKTLFGLRLLISISLAFVAVFISQLVGYNQFSQTGFSPLVKTGIVIVSLTVITQALFTTANAYFQKTLRYDLSTIAAVFGAAVFVAGTLLVTIKNPSLIAYSAVYVASQATTMSLAYLLVTNKLRSRILPQLTLNNIKELVKPAWPVGLALILNIIYFRIDVFILSSFRPSIEVGIYGLAYQFFEASLAIPIFFANTLYPLLIKTHSQNLYDFKKQVNHWLKILFIIAFFLLIFLVIISEFIPFIYNGQFKQSVPVLKILSLGLPSFFLTAVLWHALIILGRQKLLVAAYLAGLLFNLTINLIFIPPFGYLAAALTTVASEAFILALLTIAYLRSYNLPAHSSLNLRAHPSESKTGRQVSNQR